MRCKGTEKFNTINIIVMAQKKDIRTVFLKNKFTGATVMLCNGREKTSTEEAEITAITWCFCPFKPTVEDNAIVYQTRSEFEEFVPRVMALFGWEDITDETEKAMEGGAE